MGDDGEEATSTYIAQDKPRNRPSIEEAAVRYSAQNIGIPNGSHAGKGINRGRGRRKSTFRRYRCEIDDRLATERRLPCQKVPAFNGPARSQGNRGMEILAADNISADEENLLGKGEYHQTDGQQAAEPPQIVNDNAHGDDPICVTDG